MKLNKLLLLLGIIAFSFTACDEYSAGERWETIPPSQIKKNVLIEDFTGQKCSNCPKAAETAHNIQTTFGADHIIVVAMHGGSLSASADSDEQGLANNESKAYNERFMGKNSYPMGSVDRGVVTKHDQWSNTALKRLTVQPKVDLSINSNDIAYDAATHKLNLKVGVKANADVTGKLQVWLIEDGVVAYQETPEDIVFDYTHNHVFRATLNGMDGDELTLSHQQTVQKEYTYTLPDFSVWKNNTPWNVQHLSVVAFYYNASDGVMQVISQKVQ